MSRTYRRTDSKGQVDAYWWYKKHQQMLYNGEDVFLWVMEKKNIGVEDAIIRSKVIYHSDRDKGWNAPKSWRLMFTRELRSKNNQMLKDLIKKEKLETPDFIPFKRNMNWYYF